jgi:hypothetical protein
MMRALTDFRLTRGSSDGVQVRKNEARVSDTVEPSYPETVQDASTMEATKLMGLVMVQVDN